MKISRRTFDTALAFEVQKFRKVLFGIIVCVTAREQQPRDDGLPCSRLRGGSASARPSGGLCFLSVRTRAVSRGGGTLSCSSV